MLCRHCISTTYHLRGRSAAAQVTCMQIYTVALPQKPALPHALCRCMPSAQVNDPFQRQRSTCFERLQSRVAANVFSRTTDFNLI